MKIFKEIKYFIIKDKNLVMYNLNNIQFLKTKYIVKCLTINCLKKFFMNTL